MMATRDELVAWLRREAHRIDTIRERVGRAAEGPGWEDDRHRDSRRHRQTLYKLADRLDAAHEATLEALDMFDPEWDDKPEPIHDDPARTDYVRGKLHGCLCAWDDDRRIILNSACPVHGITPFRVAHERPPGVPADCIGTEWLPNGQCDTLQCRVHYTDLDRRSGLAEYRDPSDRRGRAG